MNKRIVSIFFSICALTSVYGLRAMRPGQGQKPTQTVDLNKQLENAVMKGEDKKVLSLFKLGVNPNKVNEKGETPLFIAISVLNTLPDAFTYLNFKRGDMDLDSLLLKIKEGSFYKDNFLGRLNIVRLLFEHGAVIDGKSSMLYKELMLKSPNFPEYIVLDRYIKLLSGYAQQKDNASRAKYIESKRTTEYAIMYPFLVKVCFGRSLQEVNLNSNMDIKNTAIKSLYDETPKAEMVFYSVLNNAAGKDFNALILDAAQKNGYYLRPNFFSSVKQQVVQKQKPPVPAKPKVFTVIKQEWVKPVAPVVKTGTRPVQVTKAQEGKKDELKKNVTWLDSEGFFELFVLDNKEKERAFKYILSLVEKSGGDKALFESLLSEYISDVVVPKMESNLTEKVEKYSSGKGKTEDMSEYAEGIARFEEETRAKIGKLGELVTKLSSKLK